MPCRVKSLFYTVVPEISPRSKKLPTIPLNLCHIVSDQNIASVSVEGIKMLVKERSNSIYSLIKGLDQDDVSKVVKIIRETDENEQAPLVERIGWVLQLKNDKNIERIKCEGIGQHEDEMDGTFLCRVFIEEFNTFHKIANRSFGDFLFENRSFTIFSQIMNIPNLDNFSFTPTVVEKIKNKCKKHFINRSYSDYCEFTSGNYGPNNGLAIDRGSRENGAAKIKSGKTVFNPERYKKSDIFFIDKNTGLLWVSVQNVNHADLEFYRSMVSEAVTGRTDTFKILNFDFSILHNEVLSTLYEKSFGKVKKILLREVKYKAKIGKSHRGPFTTTRQHDDCLTKYSDFMNERKNIGQFTYAKFHLYLEGDVKDEIIIKQHSVSTKNQIRESDIVTFLNKLGFMPKGHYDA